MHDVAIRRSAPRGRSVGRRIGWAALLGAVLLTGACSNRQKKLSSGGGLGDSMGELFGSTKDPAYYYGLVRDSHECETFQYRCVKDPYLVDKNIDALQHLGDGPFARLEGQANTVTMLVEVLLEDRRRSRAPPPPCRSPRSARGSRATRAWAPSTTAAGWPRRWGS